MPAAARLRNTAGVALVALTLGCVTNGYMAHRGLHYVDGELVESEPPPPKAYEAYIRARLALERDLPDLEAARGHILDALRWQPEDPQLWTVRAEIEWRAGERDAAERALGTALELRPGYAEAERLLARIHDDDNGDAQATAARAPRSP